MGQALEQLRRSRIRVVGKKSSPERLTKFLDTLADVGVLAEACRQAGFSTTTAKWYMEKARNGEAGFVDFKWRDLQGPFDELVQAALSDAVEKVEACVYHRALGYEEVQTYQGRVQYEIDYEAIALGAEPGSYEAILKDKSNKPIPVTVTKQSEDLQMFILKARRPDIYGAKSQVEMLHRGGVMVVTAPAKTSAELEARAKRMQSEAVDVEFVEIEDEAMDPLSP